MCETWISLSDEIARIMEGLAVGPTREAHGPTATAQAVRAAAQHTTLAGATGVVIWDDWESSRAGVLGAGPTRLPDDGHGSRARPGDRKPGEAARHSIARRAIP